jgi:cell division ATPase FtsA
MEKENIAVGLDIGTTKIVAMIGRKNEYGKLEILGIGKSKSLGVKRGVVDNITQTIQSIQQAVLESRNQFRLQNKRCSCWNCGTTYSQYSTQRLHQQK